MLDDYARRCPRCAAELARGPLRCPSCHKLLPRRLVRTRRVIENTLLGIALAATAFVLLAPDLARKLIGREASAAAVVVQNHPWEGPGPEPAAREWAAPLEQSLRSVCRTTYPMFADQKFILASLTQELPQIGGILALDANEQKEAFAIFGDEERFSMECLRWSYDALAACERYKANLQGLDANQCMINVVEKTLSSAPFVDCASRAKQPRVKRACALAAERIARRRK